MANHYRHFKHLHIPDQWEQYWSKYPNGYSLMEALINWVGQVNDMVDVSNETNEQINCLQRNFNALEKELRASWAGYKDNTEKTYKDFRDEVYTIINNWIATIEPTIQDEVVNSLSGWLQDGTLSDIINEDVFNMKADKTEVAQLDELVKQNKKEIKKDGPYFSGVSYFKKIDRASQTEYVLTLIPHKNSDGQTIQLKKHVATNGTKVRDFANTEGATVAFNAGTFNESTFIPDGIYIENGVIKKEGNLQERNYVLAFKEDNTLKAFPPTITAQEILDEGFTNASTAFIPLLVGGEKQEHLFGLHHFSDKHPRQAIGQKPNKDIIVLSCGGRGLGGEGMTADDLASILLENGASFGYMLDGGGSVSTVVRNKLVSRTIDDSGIKEREVADILYFSRPSFTERDKNILETNLDSGEIKQELDMLGSLFGGFGEFKERLRSVDNLNTLDGSGLFWALGKTPGAPTTDTSWVVLHLRYDDKNAMQFALPFKSIAGTPPKIRRTKPDGWDPWWDV